MDRVPFEISIDWTEAGSIIRLKGDINSTAQPKFDAAYEAAAQVDGTIVLDFEQAGFIDSTGIATVLRFLRRARAEGRAVTASGLSPHYREVFEITHVSDFMSLGPGSRVAETTESPTTSGGDDERNGGP